MRASSDQVAAVAKPAVPPAAHKSTASRTTWLWAGILALVLGIAGLWYFQPWVSKGLAVTVETVAPAPLTRILAVNGRIAPLHLVDIKPTVGGKVVAGRANEGDAIKAGAILTRVDPTQQQAAVRQAMAGLDAGMVTLSQADAKLARAEALGGAIARTALEDAQTVRQTAGQEVARLTALFDQTQIELTKYTLVAPIAGTILARQAEVGQVVDPATAVFTVADLGQLVVETDVDESYATKIVPGLRAVIRLKGGTEKLNGSVSFVAPQVDAATGGLAIKIAFDAPVVVPVGLTVTANIIVDQIDAAIAIPRAAVEKANARQAVLRDAEAFIPLIEALPEVIAVSPQINGAGFMTRGSLVSQVVINGIEPGKESAIIGLQGYLTSGTVRLGTALVVIGKRLAEDLSLSVGNTIRLDASTGANTVLTVVGIYEIGQGGFDRATAYGSLATARTLFWLPQGVTRVEIKFTDIYASDAVAMRISTLTGLDAKSWTEEGQQLLDARQAQAQTRRFAD